MKQPRILVIQDISLSCRVSMNVAVPVLSCLGNWVSVLPTALLSAHTGKGFEGGTYLDLSQEIPSVLAHWSALHIKFDGIVIGYLGAIEQMRLAEMIIENFTAADATIVLDPVMGDGGHLYSGFSDAYVSAMRRLCKKADVLLPNMTEACLLTGRPYPSKSDAGLYKKADIETLMTELATLAVPQIILTGVQLDTQRIGSALLSADDPSKVDYAFAKFQPASFFGTGDLFTSTVAGLLFQGFSLKRASEIAAEYVSRAVERTLGIGADSAFGVAFEADLPFLMEQLKTLK